MASPLSQISRESSAPRISSWTQLLTAPRRIREVAATPLRRVSRPAAEQCFWACKALSSVSVISLLTLFFGPLVAGFLLLQCHLMCRTSEVLARRGELSLGSLNPLEAQRVDFLMAEVGRRPIGRELGYVEMTIPPELINVFDDAGGEKENAVLNVETQPIDGTEQVKSRTAGPWRLTPPKTLGPIVSKPFPMIPPKYTEREKFELTWDYDADDKLIPHVGNEHWLKQFTPGTRSYYNSLATFPFAENEANPVHRMHGLVGVYPNGTQAWNSSPMPPPVDEHPEGRKEAMRNGGFYLNLSNALPLDREPDDTRDDVCKTVHYDYTALEDASVIITFYNEPLSTLLRSVHSVLNLTPPPLLREIILVDDHSNLPENLPGSDLYEYLQLLPKTKLMRLPERRGLVWARLAGAQAAKAPVLVVLDSHIEVNLGWLEPQLQRLAESPKSVVFPQIMALDADAFTYNRHAGIGCWLSWKWNMVERSTLTGDISKPDPIASPAMAGGLFAVRLDWFWEIGGYDEEFAMWGSENVEMGFRTWMCGGRMECTPCSRTYHIYRDGGVGYSSPWAAVWKNKIRTARLWMDEWFQVAQKFIGTAHDDSPAADIGNIDGVLELKKRLNCKPFSWFMQEVDPKHEGQNLDDITIFGEVRNMKYNSLCLDTMGHSKKNETYDVFSCHGEGGSQGWFNVKPKKKIHSFNDDGKCLARDGDRPVFWHCGDSEADVWSISDEDQLVHDSGDCLTVVEESDHRYLTFQPCNSEDQAQRWTMEKFERDPDFALPDFSPEYKRRHGMLEN